MTVTETVTDTIPIMFSENTETMEKNTKNTTTTTDSLILVQKRISNVLIASIMAIKIILLVIITGTKITITDNSENTGQDMDKVKVKLMDTKDMVTKNITKSTNLTDSL